MLKPYYCFSLFVLLPLFSFQVKGQRLSGRVLDAVSGQPVPYASISVPGTDQGTTGNLEGEFELARLKLPARLIVSELGHRTDTVTAGQTALVVRLQPVAVELPDVVPGAYTVELIRKAYRHLQHANRPAYGEAFYRQITQLDKEPTEVQEMVWHTKASGIGIEETAPYQGRYAKKKALSNFSNFSGFTKSVGITSLTADSITSTLLLSLNPTNDYTLRLLGVRQDGSRELAEIGFISKPGQAQKSGSIWIDTDTYQVLRLRQVGPFINTSTNRRGYNITQQTTSAEWVFRPLENGSTALTYIKVDYQGSLQQPRKPAIDVRVSAFTIFYDDKATPAPGVAYQPFKASKESDLEAIKALPYEPAFWQNNSAVKRTPLENATIQAFEQKGAFGTLLTP